MSAPLPARTLPPARLALLRYRDDRATSAIIKAAA